MGTTKRSARLRRNSTSNHMCFWQHISFAQTSDLMFLGCATICRCYLMRCVANVHTTTTTTITIIVSFFCIDVKFTHPSDDSRRLH